MNVNCLENAANHTSEFKVGQWVVSDIGGEPGYVEKIENGLYEIRLLSQWNWSGRLPVRTGSGFKVLNVHGYEEEIKKQADRIWHLLGSA